MAIPENQGQYMRWKWRFLVLQLLMNISADMHILRVANLQDASKEGEALFDNTLNNAVAALHQIEGMVMHYYPEGDKDGPDDTPAA